MNDTIKKVYGKSENSGEESGWIERQYHSEEAKRRNNAMIEKIRLQDEHTKELVRQVLIEEGLIKPST